MIPDVFVVAVSLGEKRRDKSTWRRCCSFAGGGRVASSGGGGGGGGHTLRPHVAERFNRVRSAFSKITRWPCDSPTERIAVGRGVPF